MTACAWCGQSFPTKPDKHFCCAAHRQAFHAACRAYTHDMLAQGLLTKQVLVERYGPCTASHAPASEAMDMRGMLTQQGEG